MNRRYTVLQLISFISPFPRSSSFGPYEQLSILPPTEWLFWRAVNLIYIYIRSQQASEGHDFFRKYYTKDNTVLRESQTFPETMCMSTRSCPLAHTVDTLCMLLIWTNEAVCTGEDKTDWHSRKARTGPKWCERTLFPITNTDPSYFLPFPRRHFPSSPTSSDFG